MQKAKNNNKEIAHAWKGWAAMEKMQTSPQLLYVLVYRGWW